MIGTALRERLTADGHEVVRVIRGNQSDPAAHWNPESGWFREGALEGVDAVVSLMGASIGEGRWTESRKKELSDSRVKATRLLVDHLASLERKPATFVSASAVGFYGDRGDEELTEESAKGTGFLAELVEDWEEETFRARDAGMRTVATRFGPVMSRKGGALSQMLLPFKLGVGGRLASGKQWMAMVSLDDAVGALVHALTSPLEGVVNVTAAPATNAEFTKELGKALHRPTLFPVPSFALKTLFGGELADELLLVSQRVISNKLAASGYSLRYPSVSAVVGAALAD